MKHTSPAHGAGMPWRGFLRSRGFTVVELVLVLAIIGTVATIAVPRISHMLAAQRALAAGNRVAADLRRVAAVARAATRTWSVTFDAGDGVYKAAGLDASGASVTWSVTLGDEPYLASIKKISLGADNAVTYSAYGTPGESGTIRVASGDASCLVTIDQQQATVAVALE